MRALTLGEAPKSRHRGGREEEDAGRSGKSTGYRRAGSPFSNRRPHQGTR